MSASLPLVPDETKKEEMKKQFDMSSKVWLERARFDPTIYPMVDPRIEDYSDEKFKQKIKDLIAFILDGEINQNKFAYGLSLLPEDRDPNHPFRFVYEDESYFPLGFLHFLPMFLYHLARRKVFDSFSTIFSNAHGTLYDRYKLIEEPHKKDLFRKIFEKQGDEFFNVCGTCLLFTAIHIADVEFFKYILQRSKKDLCDARWPDSVEGQPYRSPYALDRAICIYTNRKRSQALLDIARTLLEMGCNPNIHRFSILSSITVTFSDHKEGAILELLKYGASILNLNIELYHSGDQLYKELKTSSFAYALKGFMRFAGFRWWSAEREQYRSIMKIFCDEGALLVLPKYRIRNYDENCQEQDLGYEFDRELCNEKLCSEDMMDSALSVDAVPPSSGSRWSRFTAMIISPLVSMNLVPKKIEVNDITVGKLLKSEIALRFIQNGKPSWLFTIADLKLLLNRFFTHREEFDDEQAERFARIAAQVSEFEDPKNEILKRGVKEAFLEFDEKVKDEFKAIRETLMDLGRLCGDTSLLTMKYLYAFRSDDVPTTYCPAYLRRKAYDPKLPTRRPKEPFVNPASAAASSTISVPAPSGGGSRLVPAPVQAIPAPHAETKEVQDIQFSAFYQQHTLPAFAAHVAAAARSTDPSPAAVVDPAPASALSKQEKRRIKRQHQKERKREEQTFKNRPPSPA